MLTLSELPQPSVTLTVVDGDATHAIVAERRKGARLSLRCSCTAQGREGWCGHLVEVLCLRTGRLRGSGSDWVCRLEDLVLGTPLEDLAHEVDHAWTEYDEARRALEACPLAPGERGRLPLVAEHAGALASAARSLDDALERFRRRLGDAQG